MAYHACGSGKVKLNSNISLLEKKKVIDQLTTVFGVFELEDDNAVLDVVYEYDNYQDDLIFECLSNLSNYIESGQMFFVGEDDNHWMIEYDESASDWADRNGEIVFDNQKVYVVLKDGDPDGVFTYKPEADMYVKKCSRSTSASFVVSECRMGG